MSAIPGNTHVLGEEIHRLEVLAELLHGWATRVDHVDPRWSGESRDAFDRARAARTARVRHLAVLAEEAAMAVARHRESVLELRRRAPDLPAADTARLRLQFEHTGDEVAAELTRLGDALAPPAEPPTSEPAQVVTAADPDPSPAPPPEIPAPAPHDVTAWAVALNGAWAGASFDEEL